MTQYVLPHNFLEKILHLKERYNKATNIDLDNAPQPYAISTMFGARDVESRCVQVEFLQGLAAFCTEEYALQEETMFDNHELSEKDKIFKQIQSINALMTLFIAARFVYHKKASSGELHAIIKDAMGIDRINVLDQPTLGQCYKRTDEFLRKEEIFSHINSFLTSRNLPLISIDLFRELRMYTSEQAKLPEYSNLKCTNAIYPLIVNPMRAGGYAIGAMAADFISRSSTMMGPNGRAAAALGSTMVFFGGGYKAAVFAAPPMALSLMNNYITIILAWACGNSMAFLGAVLSYSLGLTLDATRIASIKAGNYVYDLTMGDKGEKILPTGIELATGCAVVNGIVLKMVQEQEMQNLTLKEVPYMENGCDNGSAETASLLHTHLESPSLAAHSEANIGAPLPYLEELESSFANKKTRLSSSI